MPDPFKRPYFDTSLFIAYIQREQIGDPAHWKVVKSLLEGARGKQFQIVTSTITIAECYRKRFSRAEDGSRLPPTRRLSDPENSDFLRLLEEDYFIFVDADRNICEAANRLCLEYEPSLMPNDAIHLASALRAKCDVLLAYDGVFPKLDRSDIHTMEPGMIGHPTLPLDD